MRRNTEYCRYNRAMAFRQFEGYGNSSALAGLAINEAQLIFIIVKLSEVLERSGIPWESETKS